jgi:hypothetical protein
VWSSGTDLQLHSLLFLLTRVVLLRGLVVGECACTAALCAVFATSLRSFRGDARWLWIAVHNLIHSVLRADFFVSQDQAI